MRTNFLVVALSTEQLPTHAENGLAPQDYQDASVLLMISFKNTSLGT